MVSRRLTMIFMQAVITILASILFKLHGEVNSNSMRDKAYKSIEKFQRVIDEELDAHDSL